KQNPARHENVYRPFHTWLVSSIYFAAVNNVHPVALSVGSAPAPGAVVGASPTTPGALAFPAVCGTRTQPSQPARAPVGAPAAGALPHEHAHALRGQTIIQGWSAAR